MVTGTSTDTTSPGSIVSPNAKKNSAPNASRSGWTKCITRSRRAAPPRMIPAISAPIAYFTPSSSESPATSSTSPMKQTTNSSSSSVSITRATACAP